MTMLLDGFPRNVAQADILAETAAASGATIKSAVLLDVPDEVIFDRIAGRRTCPKCKAGYHVTNLPPKVEGICDQCGAELTIRKDDNPDTVKDRLTVYHAQTEPLIEYYEKAGLLRKINGLGDTAEIASNFLSAM
jgi:adenylate kinase